MSSKEAGRGGVPTLFEEKHGQPPNSATNGPVQCWGDIGLGRLPQFIREDSGMDVGRARTLEDANHMDKDAIIAYRYKCQKA